MHDFCLTIPYGMLVMIGGVIGFLVAGSKVSLMAGVAPSLWSVIVRRLQQSGHFRVEAGGSDAAGIRRILGVQKQGHRIAAVDRCITGGGQCIVGDYVQAHPKDGENDAVWTGGTSLPGHGSLLRIPNVQGDVKTLFERWLK